jgi:phenylalanyl-tRNA synthetase beta chain
MICSYEELTPNSLYYPKNEDHYVVTLDDAIIGDTNVAKYIGLDDTIYDLSLPSNRNDLNSVLSLCKELSGYFKFEFELPIDITINEISPNDVQLSFDQNLLNSAFFLKVDNLKIGKSS